MTTSAAFDRGAPRYDLMVGLNPGYHRELRRAAEALVHRVGRRPGTRLLDMACGSGASTKALLAAAGPDAQILGLDASEGMLAQARRKRWPASVRFGQAVAGDLEVAAHGPDSRRGILACYLFRNVPAGQRDAAVAELFDLLEPGGWLTVQEYSVAGNRRARIVWDIVCRGVIIPLGVVVDRNNHDLYRYLWRSVIEFDTVGDFCDRLVRAGFTDVAHRTSAGWQRGILHTYLARKPRKESP